MAPTVADITVQLTFIDHEGSRATVPGRVGMSISDVAEMHGIDIGPTCGGGVIDKVHSDEWTEDLFGACGGRERALARARASRSRKSGPRGRRATEGGRTAPVRASRRRVGEGVNLGYDHVQIPQVWLEKVRARTDWELELLKSYWDEDDITPSSRLGSQVVLQKDLDGIQIFIPDGIPVEGSL